MKILRLFCHGFAIFVTAASIFAQPNEPAPPSGKDFKSILIVPAQRNQAMVNQFRSLWLGDGGEWNDHPAGNHIARA